MLTHPIRGPRAWRADTIDDRRSWYHVLSPRCLAALDRVVGEDRRNEERTSGSAPLPILDETPAGECTADLKPALTDLEDGRGFVILRGLPVERYDPYEMRLCYWLLGQMLGRPHEQNVQGA